MIESHSQNLEKQQVGLFGNELCAAQRPGGENMISGQFITLSC